MQNKNFCHASLFGLAPGGVYHAGDVTTTAVSSCLTISPLLSQRQAIKISGIFSVALSLGLPPLFIKEHPTLWRPDFPLVSIATDQRPPTGLQSDFFKSLYEIVILLFVLTQACRFIVFGLIVV